MGWLSLRPSLIERRWRRAAALLSVLAALALATVAEGFVWMLVLMLVAGAAWVLRAPAQAWRLRLSQAGFELAAGTAGEPQAARVVFVARSLIVLACGRDAVALWSDSLSPDHFRLVSVHARWPVAPRPTGGAGDESP